MGGTRRNPQVKQSSHLENSVMALQKIRPVVILRSSSSVPTSIPKRNENIRPHSDLYLNVDSSIICNSPKGETPQMSIKRGVDKQVVFYPHNGMLLAIKRMNLENC